MNAQGGGDSVKGSGRGSFFQAGASVAMCALALLAALAATGCSGAPEGDDEPVDAAGEEVTSGGSLPAYGMNYGAVTYGAGPLGPLVGHFENLAAADMGYARLWFHLDGDNAAAFDAPMADAVSHGALVLPILFTTTASGKLGVDNLSRWHGAVHAVAVRFGPKTKTSGTFWKQHPELPYRPVRVWEIWNEENTTNFWSSGSVDGYYHALKEAHAALRAADPRARVVMGGLIFAHSTKFTYLETILGKPGGNCLFDALAIHPYAKDVQTAMSLVEIAHKELVQERMPEVPLWITEVGWAVDGSWAGNRATLTTPNDTVQAAYFSAFAKAVAAHRAQYNIGATFWFNYQDLGGEGWDNHAGLFTVDPATLQPAAARPAFAALAAVAHAHPHAELPPLRCPGK